MTIAAAFSARSDTRPPSDPPTLAATVDQELRRLAAAPAHRIIPDRMIFPPELEARFDEEARQARIDWLRRILAIGILLFNMVSFTDTVLFPDLSFVPAAVRLCLVTPLTVLLLVYMPVMSDRTRETATFAVVTLAITVLGVFPFLSNNDTAPFGNANALLALIFCCVTLPLRFIDTLRCVAITSLIWCLIGMITFRSASGVLIVLSIQWIATTLVCVITVFRIEHSARLQFLMRTAERIRISAITAERDVLSERSDTDALTGVANRHFMDRSLDHLLTHDSNLGRRISLILLDIDHFKLYNDHYGHPSGDQCLKLIAAELKRHLRGKSDFVARYGGEEFIVLLADIDADAARSVSTRLCDAVAKLRIPHEGRRDGGEFVTVSIGVNPFIIGNGQSLATCIRDADQALYSAKRLGRNRVIMTTDLAA